MGNTSFLSLFSEVAFLSRGTFGHTKPSDSAVIQTQVAGSYWDWRWRDRSSLLSCTPLQSELPERLNNIPEAQMKHFLHSGCLLRSVFEVELKMSSFLYQRNVPRGEIVIQIGCKGRKKGRGRGGGRQTESKRRSLFPCYV